MIQNPEFSVVVPVYNSENTLQELFSRIRDTFLTLGKSFEVIFVEDCGKDNSWKVLEDLRASSPEGVTCVKLSRNFGQYNATFCGISFARGQYIITIDDDLQIPPEEISKLILARENEQAELVYGYYPDKKHSIVRNLGSRMLKKATRQLDNAPGEASSFRLFSAELAGKVLNVNQHFVFIDELLVGYTGQIGFAEVRHEKRRISSSGYSLLKLLKTAFRILFLSTSLTLKLMIYGGFLSAMLSFLAGVFFILKKVFFRVPIGYTSIIVTILFSTGILLFFLGIIGEFLIRIYEGLNKKPPFLIKKILR